MSLEMGTPSMTNSAVLLSCVSDDSPRSVTRIEPPGPCPAWSKFSPATLPAMPLSQLLETVLFRASLPSLVTA